MRQDVRAVCFVDATIRKFIFGNNAFSAKYFMFFGDWHLTDRAQQWMPAFNEVAFVRTRKSTTPPKNPIRASMEPRAGRSARCLTKWNAKSLRPLPAERFPFFHKALRTVHRDGHELVQQAYYSLPPECCHGAAGLGRGEMLIWSKCSIIGGT